MPVLLRASNELVLLLTVERFSKAVSQPLLDAPAHSKWCALLSAIYESVSQSGHRALYITRDKKHKQKPTIPLKTVCRSENPARADQRPATLLEGLSHEQQGDVPRPLARAGGGGPITHATLICIKGGY